MYLRNIAISNYHTFTYHPELILTKGMEFETDPYTSNVNILIWPNGSGKSNFLNLLTVLCNLHLSWEGPRYRSTLEYPSETRGGGFSPTVNKQNKVIKKHNWFESYPTIILAQRVMWWASEEHSITVRYDLDKMNYEIIEGNTASLQHFNYHLLSISRVPVAQERSANTIKLAEQYLGILYNPNNNSYMASNGSIRKRDDLGSGEKSLIRMINEINATQTVWWIVIIDEPELHLHPQYQRQLWVILELLSQQGNCQIIIATHSPFFINELNIENVFRFAMRDGHNHIINPVDFRGQAQARVKQILTDWNMAKIFFADILIMVEWDTDEYFMHYYIAYYLSKHNIKPRRYNFEILNIAGKSSLSARRSFCRQFQIDRSFIGDWDNVISISPFGSQIEQVKVIIPHHQYGKKLTKSQQYQALIQKISDEHPELEKQIARRIDQQAYKRSYILRHGDLEAYLWLHDKWLDETIRRCNTRFDDRIKNPYYQHYRNDLDTILDKIFHVKSD